MRVSALVSVIIPTYNRLDLLKKAIESCLAQSCLNLEIIIVDDGSQDGTKAMVEARLKGEWKDCGIRYMHQENGGASLARNHGLSLAVGDYIQFLDSDDELLPAKIRTQLTYLEDPANQKRQMCYCFGRMGEYAEGECQRIGIEAAHVEDLLECLVSRTTHVMPTTSPLWRKSFLDTNKGWDIELGLGDDLEYFLRLTCVLDGFGFIPEELFFVRVHQASRLSADNMTRKSLLSAIRTQELVHTCLDRSGFWTPRMKRSFFSGIRVLYANCLFYGDMADVFAFEKWLKEIGRDDPAFRELKFLMSFRGLFGEKVLLGLHQGIMKLRELF